jgi:uncharacterized protein YdhG (YjbR/CyaY superfamily)
MTYAADSPAEYIQALPDDRRAVIEQLRAVILENIPDGFQEGMGYGMIGYVVPHRLYPAGYHCDPKLPLPFVSIAAQKNFYALYHMGIYAQPELLTWFVDEYPKHSAAKLDMGKSCIRFKKPEHIPYALIGQLMQKMTVEEWVSIYESNKR